jgi:hypothetical protein
MYISSLLIRFVLVSFVVVALEPVHLLQIVMPLVVDS